MVWSWKKAETWAFGGVKTQVALSSMILTFSFKTTNYGFPHVMASWDSPLWMKGPFRFGEECWGLCDLPSARVGPEPISPRLEVKLSKSTYPCNCLFTTFPKATPNPKLGVISNLSPVQLRQCLSNLYLPLPPRTSPWTHAVGCRAINLFLIPEGLSPLLRFTFSTEISV